MTQQELADAVGTARFNHDRGAARQRALRSFAIVWADGFYQNPQMLLYIVTVVSIKLHIHSLYFERAE